MEDEVQAAVLELDAACDSVAEKLVKCVGYVNEGRLDGNVLMLKINELAARLMQGGAE